MPITVIGSLNYDLVTYTAKVPEAGETFQANSFENHLGGKGLNEALASSRLLPDEHKGSVRMIGNIGNDSFGKELKQALTEAEVDTLFVQTIENQSSGVAVILVEEETGENRILITAGANGELKPTEEDYGKYFPETKSKTGTEKSVDFVILQNEYPEPLETIAWVKNNRPSINIAYNPSPFKPELVNLNTFSQIDLLILNEGEANAVASKLFGKTYEDFNELAVQLSKLINQENICTVVITLGSKGSVFVSKRSESSSDTGSFVPSIRVDKVVDTTGAGDTFFGGVVLQLSVGSTIEDAVKFATVASSLTIRSKGAAESIPTYEAVTKERS